MSELEPWVAGYHDSEKDRVMLALADMYSAFPAMGNKSTHEAAAKLDAVLRALAPYPAWAIQKACERISTKGFTRSEGDKYITERHWPPSDPELIEAVRQERAHYGDQYDRVVELLTAEIEEP